MAKYGVFSVPDAKRIAAATRRVEGSPRNFLHVPERISRVSSQSSRTRVAEPQSFTIAEYVPATGEIVALMDRGRRRFSPSSTDVSDRSLLYSSDGYLYAAGNGWLNENNGVLVKWNVERYAVEWYSDQGAFTSPGVQLLSNGSLSGSLGGGTKMNGNICEATDGAIWVAGTGSGTSYIAKFSAASGSQTVEISGIHVQKIIAGVSGSIVVVSSTVTGGKYARVYDSTGSETASFTAFSPTVFDVSGTVIATTNGSTLKTLNLSDLSEISSRSAPAGETYVALATDGTTVWAATSHATTPRYRSYSAANLATENWAANRATSSNTTIRLLYANSAIYDFSQTLRKINATSGAEIWSFSGGATTPTTERACAVNTGYAYTLQASSLANLFAVDDSDGTAVWLDGYANNTFGSVLATSNGRLFVSCLRTGP